MEQLQTPMSNNKQQINNKRINALERKQPKPPGGGGGVNAFYWYRIFALDSAVVELQEIFSSHGSLLSIAMYHHGETL